MSYDPQQRFLSFVPGGNGIIYAIQADGDLYWYRNTGWPDGSATWANNGVGRLIGTAWQQFRIVVAAADGQIFAVRPNGDLKWYQYILTNPDTGEGNWHPSSGVRIGNGWNFPRIIGGWNNVLYGQDEEGNLFWYKYTGTGGVRSWAPNSGAKIGYGFKSFTYLFADPNGVIFAINAASGSLFWYRYLGTDGSPTWANNGAGINLGILVEYYQQAIFSNGSGTIYRVRLSNTNPPGPDTDLMWYRLQNSETIDTDGIQWFNNKVGLLVGSGFTSQWSGALQGYPSSVSNVQGATVGIQVSTTFSSYTSSTVRLAPATGAPVQVTPPVTQAGKLQLLQANYRSAGCGWGESFTIPTTPASSFPSGIYASLLKSPYLGEYYVMFVVRPPTPPAAAAQRVAVLVPTNTYNAYNYWGGHNQYTSGQVGVQRTITLQRPNMGLELGHTYVTAPGIIDRRLYSDLLLLRWMTSAGIPFDCYSDGDLDATGATWLRTANYRGLVLTTHPEYFTETARTNVANYRTAGGRIIYLGGNGIYEEVQYPSTQAITYRRPDGTRNLFREDGQPETDILGVGFYSPSYNTFAPYQVKSAHPFLNGTGLSVGSTFGAVGYSGPASGFEIDVLGGSATSQAVLIAKGLNSPTGGDMIYWATPNTTGGWVFTASSQTFNGAVPYDAAIRKILQNVFAAAVV